jgi:hypothetical protein
MRIATRLRTLLRRRGCPISEAVSDALTDFVATVLDENPSAADDGPDAEDEDGSSLEDLAQTRSIACPHCGEAIDIAIDLSGGDQDDVQDCSVCCSPIRVAYTVERGRLRSFSAEAS